MKNISFLLTVFLVLSSSSFAQLDKNYWLVGGAGNFYSSKRDYISLTTPAANGNSKELNLNISPTIGYFPIDKFAVGLRPYISWGKGESTSSNGTIATGNSKRYGIGPFARYYFLDKEKQFNVLTDISYQMGEWKQSEKGQLVNFSFVAGPVIYFNTAVGMEFLLGYSKQTEELKGFSKNSSKGFIITMGFQIHLTN